MTKKILFFLSILILGQMSTSCSVLHNNQSTFAKKGKKKKNGRYKKKQGLFKGKNQCDCPKY